MNRLILTSILLVLGCGLEQESTERRPKRTTTGKSVDSSQNDHKKPPITYEASPNDSDLTEESSPSDNDSQPNQPAKDCPPRSENMDAAMMTAALASTDASYALLQETSPTFEGSVKGIIYTKCSWCHSSTAEPGTRRRPYLETFQDVSAELGEIFETILSGEMPPRNDKPDLTADEIQILQNWRDLGAPQGAPKAINFAMDIGPQAEALIQSRCTGCHSVAGEAQPPLETTEQMKALSLAVYSSAMEGRMPLGTSLSDDEILLLKLFSEPEESEELVEEPQSEECPVPNAG